MKQLSISALLFSLFLLTACGGNKQTSENIVSVTIEPQRYFAERIAGDKFKINTVVPSGQNFEEYSPTAQQMIQVSKSIAYLSIGNLPFEERWVEMAKENNKDIKVFDVSDGVNLLEHEEHHHHDHCEEEHHHHHHSHVGADPHIWSSISGAKAIAWNTFMAFVEIDRENTQYYNDNYNLLMEEIERTEASVVEILSSLENRTFIIYHPALSYFANEFGLTQLCIELEGKEPSPAQLKRLIDTAKESDAQIVFIQQEFDKKSAELIAKETNCRLVVINPLNYNWSEEIIHIAQSLADGKAN